MLEGVIPGRFIVVPLEKGLKIFLKGLSERQKIKNLGTSAASGVLAPRIDVLRRSIAFWSAGQVPQLSQLRNHVVRHGCPGKPCGRHHRAGLKPAPTIAAPVVAPVVARTIAACHTGSWHQRQTDTYVNSAKRRQINPVSLYYCDNVGTVGAGFKPVRIIAAPVATRTIAAPVATRTIAAYAIGSFVCQALGPHPDPAIMQLTQLVEFLSTALPYGAYDLMRRLAQSLVHVLSPEDKERATYENFLVVARVLRIQKKDVDKVRNPDLVLPPRDGQADAPAEFLEIL